MKKLFVLISLGLFSNSYADEMVFNCPSTLYVDSVVLAHNQPLPFNVELNTTIQSTIHLIDVNLYSNNQPVKLKKIDGNYYSWNNLNELPQGLNEWIHFVCLYENNIQLTKKAIYVSDCTAHIKPSRDKKHLTSAEFQCE